MMMMMIKRILMLAAWAFVAGCPIANSFVYRFSPVQHTFSTNSMLGKKQRGEVGKTIGVPSGKTIDGAGVGRSSGAVAIEEKVCIPRVPSALDPEGITRRVDSRLHILGKGGDGEGVPVPDEEEFVPVVREGARPQSNDDHHDDTHHHQLIQQDEAAEDVPEHLLERCGKIWRTGIQWTHGVLQHDDFMFKVRAQCHELFKLYPIGATNNRPAHNPKPEARQASGLSVVGLLAARATDGVEIQNGVTMGPNMSEMKFSCWRKPCIHGMLVRQIISHCSSRKSGSDVPPTPPVVKGWRSRRGCSLKGLERRLHHHGSRPQGRYPGWTVRWEGFQQHCCTSGLSGLRSTSPTGVDVRDGFCSMCDIEHTQHEAAAPTTGAVGYPDSAAPSSSEISEPSSDTKSVPVESRSTEEYGITTIAKGSGVTNNHSRHGLEKAKGSSELPSRAVDARPLRKRVEPIQDDKSSAPTHDGSSPAHTRIAREAVSGGQGHGRKKVGRSYPHEDTGRSFFSLHLQQFDGPEDFNQGRSLAFPYFPAEISPPPVQPGATPAATAAVGHGPASRSTPPPRTTDSAAEAPAEDSPDCVDMLTAALHDAWGRGTIRGTSNEPSQDDTTAARQSSAWWPSEEDGVDADDLPQVFHDAWRKRGVRSSNALSVGGTAPAEAPEWAPSTLSQGHREQAKTQDDDPGKAAPASHPPKNGRIRRWLAKARRGWANRRGSRTRRRRDDLTW